LKRVATLVWGLALAAGMIRAPASASWIGDEDPIVRATFFYSPFCGHCHQVMEEVLPPLMEQYGHRLEIEFADVTTADGNELYQSTMAELGVPRSNWVVPILVCGDVMLVGSREIPERFPALIEERLAGGDGEDDSKGGIGRDMPGNAIAIGVLCAMVLAVVLVVRDGFRAGRGRDGFRTNQSESPPRRSEAEGWRAYLVPVLCTYGLLVSAYLSYVEMTQLDAVCGPVGDCNAVQQSDYALLFGVIPVAVVGVVGYSTMMATWLLGRRGSVRAAEAAPALLLCLAMLGTLFSIYLTFLEPFVVGATCLWCLSSAAAVTLILVLAAPAGWRPLYQEVQRLRR
jgi:uncharacterized membrane protein